MRILGRLCALAIAAALVAAAVWYFGAAPLPAFLAGRIDKEKLALVPQASLSPGYLADAENWLEFSVANGTSRLKIISHPNVVDVERLRRMREEDPARRWSYALEIEVVGKRGEPLLRKTHHLLGDLAEFTWPDGRRYTPAFYLREQLTPLSGAVLALDLGAFPEAGKLRIRLHTKDDDIADVLLRVYAPEKLSAPQAAVAWKRLSEKARETLAKGSVYPYELLLEQEISNLAANAWQPLGPRGAEGRDYQARPLYVLFDNDGQLVDDPLPSAGVVADALIRGTLPIPEGGGRLRLEITDSPRPTPAWRSRADSSATIRWYGPSLFERWEQSLSLPAGTTRLLRNVAGGLLEIETPRETSLRAWLKPPGSDEEREITPPAQYFRVFAATPQQPVDYLLESRASPSLLRLDIRRQLSPASPSAARCRYEILDAAGRILKAGWLPLELPPSHYERTVGDYTPTWLSDPGTFHFLLPPAARQVRIHGAADEELLVGAHTRPYDLAQEIRVPDDSFDYDPEGQRIPAWFPIRPEDYQQRVMENRSRVLQMQARPGEAKPDILAGRYQWEDLRPLGPWLARPILTPREPGAPAKADALPVSYTPLPIGRWQSIHVPAYQGLAAVSPSLLWLQGSGTAELQVRIDDRPPVALALAGPFAEKQLAPLSTGSHRIRIDGPSSGTAYLNYLTPGAGTLLRRIGQRFTGQLSFEFERRAQIEETLTVRLYQPRERQAPGELRVSVRPPALPQLVPLRGWIFRERRATIRPDQAFDAPVFDTAGERSDPGRPIYLPFAEDAPLGRYRITVSADRPGGYLGVTRLGPEVSPRRSLHLQPTITHVPQ